MARRRCTEAADVHHDSARVQRAMTRQVKCLLVVNEADHLSVVGEGLLFGYGVSTLR